VFRQNFGSILVQTDFRQKFGFIRFKTMFNQKIGLNSCLNSVKTEKVLNFWALSLFNSF